MSYNIHPSKNMITTILNALLTPMSVATPPPNTPAIVQVYDWGTQMSTPQDGSPTNVGTTFGTQSFIGIPAKLVIDDTNSD